MNKKIVWIINIDSIFGWVWSRCNKDMTLKIQNITYYWLHRLANWYHSVGKFPPCIVTLVLRWRNLWEVVPPREHHWNNPCAVLSLCPRILIINQIFIQTTLVLCQLYHQPQQTPWWNYYLKDLYQDV